MTARPIADSLGTTMGTLPNRFPAMKSPSVAGGKCSLCQTGRWLTSARRSVWPCRPRSLHERGDPRGWTAIPDIAALIRAMACRGYQLKLVEGGATAALLHRGGGPAT